MKAAHPPPGVSLACSIVSVAVMVAAAFWLALRAFVSWVTME